MVGINYAKSGPFLIRRGSKLRNQKMWGRKPYYKKELIAEKSQDRRSKKLLEGKTIQANPLPFGVELSFRSSSKIEICVCLPEASINRDYHLSHWGMLAPNVGVFDRSVMADVFTVATGNGKITAVCVLDFLDRLLNLKCWPEIVPIHLRRFPKPDVFFAHIDKSINGGKWNFEKSLASVMTKVSLQDLQGSVNPKFAVKDSRNALLATVRHSFSPYDYVWQTNKTSINEAQVWADWAVRVFEGIENAQR